MKKVLLFLLLVVGISLFSFKPKPSTDPQVWYDWNCGGEICIVLWDHPQPPGPLPPSAQLDHLSSSYQDSYGNWYMYFIEENIVDGNWPQYSGSGAPIVPCPDWEQLKREIAEGKLKPFAKTKPGVKLNFKK